MKKKKSNARAIILNGVAIILSTLIMIFYACPHYVNKSSVGDAVISSPNGFDAIKNMFDVDNKASATVAGIMILIVFITAAIVLLLAIVNMLGAFGVIGNVKVIKALNMLVSALLALAGILAVICLAVYLKDTEGLGITRSIGWAIAVNMVLAIGTCVVVSLDFLTSKK